MVEVKTRSGWASGWHVQPEHWFIGVTCPMVWCQILMVPVVATVGNSAERCVIGWGAAQGQRVFKIIPVRKNLTTPKTVRKNLLSC